MRRGRFEKPMESSTSEYTSSLEEDVKIFQTVVKINIAHVMMLANKGIIPKPDASKILKALVKLHDTDVSTLEMRPEMEDIHMVVEEFVVKEAGEEAGGKLHTAKSRNDQVAAAIKMVLRDDVLKVEEALLGLVEALLTKAEKNLNTVMPGYTHLQVAEPTTFAHNLTAHANALLRDVKRVEETFEFLNSSPMGACAFAGTGFPIDRSQVANLLGFKKIDNNTMDAVSSRDFALQVVSALAISMVNMSRLAEEVLLWSSSEFGMIEVPDEFSSTSSIMPQKKNPVVAETVRANTARVFGDLMGVMSLVKALPQSYNLDFQELTPMLWDAVDHTRVAAEIMGRMMAGVEPKREVMRQKANAGFSTATELADTLVWETGIPFRDAHSVVGRMVSNAVADGKTMDQLTLEDFQKASQDVLGKKLDIPSADFAAALDPVGAVAGRELPGGPAPKAVASQLKILRDKVKQHSKLLRVRARSIQKIESKLMKKARELSK